MNAVLRNHNRRRRSLSALAVLGLLYLGTFGSAAASAVDGGPSTEAGNAAAGGAVAGSAAAGGVSWAQLSLSVDALISEPAQSQAPYDARVTLDYVITNSGRVPIYHVHLDDPLVPGESVDCDGSSVVEVLPPSSSADCEATVEIPPGTYTSSPQARGWISVLLFLGFPITANAQTTFTVAAPPPPPPSSPPASPPASPPPSPSPSPPPPPSPSARPSASTPAAPPPSSPPAPPPSSTTPAPATPAAAKTSAPPPSRQPTPAPSTSRRAVVLPPPLPTAQVRQLSTHVAVLLLLLPAAVGAAVAGAAAARRR